MIIMTLLYLSVKAFSISNNWGHYQLLPPEIWVLIYGPWKDEQLS